MTRSTPPTIWTLILLSGLSALGMNIFQPSLPGMAAYFGVEYRLIALSVPLYLAASTVIQIVVGPISDKMGRRPVMMASLVLFLLATLGCIFATTAEGFLAFRMAQAVVATCMVLSRAAVRDMYEGPKAASMIGYVTMGMTVVPMIGPALGGILDQAFGWHANFWLLFAAAAVTLAIFYADFGETATASGKPLIAQFREYPALLRSPRFWGYSLAAGLSSGSFFAYLGGSPFVGTNVYGLNSAQLGIYFSAPALGYFLGNFLSGRYSERFGINAMVFWGAIINIFGVGLSLTITLVGMDSVWTFFGLMCFVGLGNGMAIPNGTTGAISVRPHLAGTAAGLSSAIMIGAGAALSATASWLLVPGSDASPLLEIMFGSGVCGLIAILYVMRRERQLGLAA
ncbi:multidrug effflux MFS transporter [Tritonibacter mobilis]|uniref:multidrug effflux MFS transporter n=1 Tax=Tritonibacter mobilis TaxID=379347 RepID=UPI000806D3C6|nr:multidrug effflux MFS transporter [Tritonibacter mobilis]GLP85457.1 Bcr/CflA family drug resistance efflux transporter [Tritonibacter mobilis]SDW71403.1 MFS transporter, DHA1 family, bicyclomycin/chloramphenicol resistance protein [Tritonibacter mobilis]